MKKCFEFLLIATIILLILLISTSWLYWGQIKGFYYLQKACIHASNRANTEYEQSINTYHDEISCETIGNFFCRSLNSINDTLKVKPDIYIYYSFHDKLMNERLIAIWQLDGYYAAIRQIEANDNSSMVWTIKKGTFDKKKNLKEPAKIEIGESKTPEVFWRALGLQQ